MMHVQCNTFRPVDGLAQVVVTPTTRGLVEVLVKRTCAFPGCAWGLIYGVEL